MASKPSKLEMQQQQQLLFHVLLFSLLLREVSAAAAAAAQGCSRRCGGLVVPYPFGFSGSCPILLSCNVSGNSTAALILQGNDATTTDQSYTVVDSSFNSTASTFAVTVPPSCNRTVSDARRCLSGANYGVSSRTGLFLRGSCRTATIEMNATACSVPGEAMSNMIRMAQCAGGNETASSLTCIASIPPNSTAEELGVGLFARWEMVEEPRCDNLLTSFYGETSEGVFSLELAVAELGWWVNGSCSNNDAAGDLAGRCAASATCRDVKTASGAWGHQCKCPAGLTGDGFAAGDGCYAAARSAVSSKSKVVAVTVGSVAFLLSLTLFVWGLLRRRQRRRNAKLTMKMAPKQDARIFRGKPIEDELELEASGPQRFHYGELAAATANFSDEKKLGSGGFGSVYRGVLNDGGVNRDVAVKRVAETSRQGWKEFVSEVKIFSRLRHRNLVPLIGWCHDGGDELLLVYELMPNGSLDAHLHHGDNKILLPWPVRYDIVLGVGAALLYLHHEAEQRVVHRDIKPSNVMLDASLTARLGDFGLARLIDDGQRSHTTGIAGTLGYMDPGCVSAFTASVEFDVYSFGVLLLEVACGRRPAVPNGRGDGGVVHLAQWVWEWHGEGAILDAADARLDGEFDGQEMERVLAVGLWCAHPDRALRPSMRQAVGVLRFDAPLPALPARMPVVTYTTPSAVADSTDGGGGGDNTSRPCSISIEI